MDLQGSQDGDDDERTPLVDNDTESHDRVPAAPKQAATKQKGYWIIHLLCFSVLLATSASGFISIPLTQLLEDSFCRDYIQSKDPWTSAQDNICKNSWVQSRIAYVVAVSGALDAVCTFLAALPWGVAADRIGRKPVVGLALIGCALSYVWWIFVLSLHPIFPVWTGWFGSATLFLGGGTSIIVAVFLSMAADATNDDTRAVAFMRVHVASMLGNLISPGISSAMMNTAGTWLVMWMGVLCLVSSGVVFMFIPEPHRPREAVNTGHSNLDNIKRTLSLLKSPWLTLLLISALLSQPVQPATVQFLPQFVSKRYGIKIQNTGYLQTAYGAAQALQALIGLPFISRMMSQLNQFAPLLQNRHAHLEQKRDLLITRWSIIVSIAGILILGLALSLWYFGLGLLMLALGSGFSSYIRSLMSLYVGNDQLSTLFSLVAMADVLGAVYSGVLFAKLFSSGMAHLGLWVGLPYFVLTITTTLAVIPLFLLQLPLSDAQAQSDDPI